MSFRTIVIDSRCKLEYSLNYLICSKGLEQTKILLDEIKLILINSTQVTITSALISECVDKKIKILFTDSKHNVSAELTPFKNNYYAARKLKQQIAFNDEYKGNLWKLILKEKINNQARILKLIEADREYNLLLSYRDDVTEHDKTNKEGVAAKVYFNTLFGRLFSRDSDCDTNKYLDYGYTIILSAISRAIKITGYYTELGIHHIGDSNSFNLSCDFVEPLRPLIDSYVVKNEVNNKNFKEVFISMLSEKKVNYNDRETFLDNAILDYVEDLISYLLTGDESKIKFINYEL